MLSTTRHATNSAMENVLKSRLEAVKRRIQAACSRSGRRREDVTLVAVTKSVEAETARLIHSLGVTDLGESRPQELWRKAAALPSTIRWHLIGHLQRNKVAHTLDINPFIHSVDRLALLHELEAQARARQITAEILLEVNASAEPNKNGFSPEALPALPGEIHKLEHVRVVGLMTMAAWHENPEHARPTFSLLRTLAEELGAELSSPHSCRTLSMGMSNDFEIAVEEGATMIRIGTAIFE
jgi:hypothetical protein